MYRTVSVYGFIAFTNQAVYATCQASTQPARFYAIHIALLSSILVKLIQYQFQCQHIDN